MFVVGGIGGSTGFARFVQSIFDAKSEVESASMRLEAMYGSAEKAAAGLELIRAVAAKTPRSGDGKPIAVAHRVEQSTQCFRVFLHPALHEPHSSLTVFFFQRFNKLSVHFLQALSLLLIKTAIYPSRDPEEILE